MSPYRLWPYSGSQVLSLMTTQHPYNTPGTQAGTVIMPCPSTLQRRKQVLREVKSFGPGCTAGGCRANQLVSESLVVLRLGCGLWGYWG